MSVLCRALLRDRADAEDAAQQTFLSAHRALLNGTEPREPAAWLATIARNECRRRIRARMREPLRSDRLELASTEHDPVVEALRRADIAALWAALVALPQQQRAALLLREFGGLSYDELEAALAVSSSAVESLLFRARRRLRKQLRSAYTALTGASWLDALARLLAGWTAPAWTAPAAAKVAALGVGAAAVTGGAVVAPPVVHQLVHHRQPQRPVPVRSQPVRVPTAPITRPARTSVPTPVVAVPPVHERREGRDDLTARASSGRDGSGSRDSRPDSSVGGDPLSSGSSGSSGGSGEGRDGSRRDGSRRDGDGRDGDGGDGGGGGLEGPGG